jgi:hypothetical protein
MKEKYNNLLADYLAERQVLKTPEEYFKYPALSSSIIKNVCYDPSVLDKPRDTLPSLYMNLGSAVDLMVTQPDNTEDIVVMDSIPSDNNIQMIELVLQHYPDIQSLEELNDEQVSYLYDTIGSRVNWGIKVKKDKLVDYSNDYFVKIKNNKNKIILTKPLYSLATDISLALQTYPTTKHLFNGSNERFTIFYQYKVTFSFSGLEFKSMFDILVIDNVHKTISIYDLKVGGNPFLSSFYKFKWYYQAGLYQLALSKLMFEFKKISNAHKSFGEEYNVEDFTFIHVNTNNIKHIFQYSVPEELQDTIVSTGLSEGFKYIYSLRGIIKAINYYMEAVEGNENSSVTYDNVMPYVLHINKGVIPLFYYMDTDLGILQ